MYNIHIIYNGYLNGQSTISSENVLIPKLVDAILANKKRTSVTLKIEMKVKIQDLTSKSFKRFQVGGFSEGNLENQ